MGGNFVSRWKSFIFEKKYENKSVMPFLSEEIW